MRFKKVFGIKFVTCCNLALSLCHCICYHVQHPFLVSYVAAINCALSHNIYRRRFYMFRYLHKISTNTILLKHTITFFKYPWYFRWSIFLLGQRCACRRHLTELFKTLIGLSISISSLGTTKPKKRWFKRKHTLLEPLLSQTQNFWLSREPNPWGVWPWAYVG